jgi:YHS domain-containing protein
VKKGDLKAELAKAYPSTTDVTAKGCPTCGKAVTAAKEVVFQGRKAKLCCDNCAAEFKKDPGLYLAKANWPDAKDAKNTTDPIDGKPVAAGVVAICKNPITLGAKRRRLREGPHHRDTKLRARLWNRPTPSVSPDAVQP